MQSESCVFLAGKSTLHEKQTKILSFIISENPHVLHMSSQYILKKCKKEVQFNRFSSFREIWHVVLEDMVSRKTCLQF